MDISCPLSLAPSPALACLWPSHSLSLSRALCRSLSFSTYLPPFCLPLLALSLLLFPTSSSLSLYLSVVFLYSIYPYIQFYGKLLFSFNTHIYVPFALVFSSWMPIYDHQLPRHSHTAVVAQEQMGCIPLVLITTWARHLPRQKATIGQHHVRMGWQ